MYSIQVGCVDIVCTPDTQGIYVDGELEEQMPRLSIERVLEVIGVPFRSYFLCSEENPSVKRGLLPPRFDRVVLEDDCYISSPPRLCEQGRTP